MAQEPEPTPDPTPDPTNLRPPSAMARPRYRIRGTDIAGFVVMGGAAVVVALQVLGIRVPVPQFDLPPPFDTPLAQMLIVAGSLIGFALAGAALLKAIEHRKVQSWPTVEGRVIRAQRGQESTVGAPVHLERPVADIAYAYEVNAERYVGTRLTLAERIGANEVEALLKRYPVGTRVEVHFDPADPASSVLERQPPKRAALGCLALIAILSIAGIAVIWVAGAVTPTLRTFQWGAFAEINGPLIMVFGAVSALFLTLAALIAAPVRTVRRWPVTTGRVLSHDIRITRSLNSARAHYPIVRYAYTVRGVERHGNALSHGSTMGGDRRFAEKVLARFPVGSTVRVHYNPDKPDEAALETRFGLFGWITLAIGVAFALIAVAVGFA